MALGEPRVGTRTSCAQQIRGQMSAPPTHSHWGRWRHLVPNTTQSTRAAFPWLVSKKHNREKGGSVLKATQGVPLLQCMLRTACWQGTHLSLLRVPGRSCLQDVTLSCDSTGLAEGSVRAFCLQVLALLQADLLELQNGLDWLHFHLTALAEPLGRRAGT